MDINYTFYTEKFGGEIIPATLFPAYATRAIVYLNSITFNQAEKYENINLGFAICDIAEIIYKEHKRSGIKHESVDGYTVTHDDATDLSHRLYDSAQTYLGCSGLLYRGGVYYDYM